MQVLLVLSMKSPPIILWLRRETAYNNLFQITQSHNMLLHTTNRYGSAGDFCKLKERPINFTYDAYSAQNSTFPHEENVMMLQNR